MTKDYTVSRCFTFPIFSFSSVSVIFVTWDTDFLPPHNNDDDDNNIINNNNNNNDDDDDDGGGGGGGGHQFIVF